jgi:uncharacterized RmlC-like cupin family protein
MIKPFSDRTTPLATALVLCIGPSCALGGDPGHSVGGASQEVVLVDTPPEILTRQNLPNFVGISGKTAGAKGLSMNLVVIPPGASAEPHKHRGYESAVYVLEGRVETRYGPGLAKSVIAEAGDFLFIPPDVPHQPINLSATEAARAIVVRNDPDEQEHVILLDPGAEE